MTQLVSQPSAMPTNKLMTGSIAASSIAVAFGPAASEVFTVYFPEFMAGGAAAMFVEILAGSLAGLAVGWFVKDRANV